MSRMASRDRRSFAAGLLLVLLMQAAAGDTLWYTYDALGRLTFVEDPANGNRDYDYDAAGNRLLVSVNGANDDANDPATAAPSTPSALNHPAHSSSGSYPVTWGEAEGRTTSYELWQANDPSFSDARRVFTGLGFSYTVTGLVDGTYYYRVRACNGSACGPFRDSNGGTRVLLIPPQPDTMTVPTLAIPGNNYQVTWGASSGSSRYELEQHGNSSFTALVQSWTPTTNAQAVTAGTQGTFYFRVRACNASGCSSYRTGANGINILAPPATPTGLSMTLASFCTWGASWNAVAGATSYNVTDSRNGMRSTTERAISIVWANPCPPPSGTNAGPDDLKPAFVQACNAAGCSANSSFNPGTTPPPNAPNGISYPLTSSTGSFTVSWGASPGGATSYEAYQGTNSGFSDSTAVYIGAGTSVALSRGNGTYYYRVRGCNGNSCSAFTIGSGITVTLPPGPPGAMSIPSSGTRNTNYTISWGAASGTIERYEVEQHSNASFTALVASWNATSTSSSVSAPAQGTFYFRVRSCNATGCSAFVHGSNGITINGPPATPTGLSSTLASFCTWSASWTAVAGAASYTVTDSDNQVRTTSTNNISWVWSSPCPPPTGTNPNPNAKKPKWVQACNTAGCSANATFP
jgi:YD repeat-containing protein